MLYMFLCFDVQRRSVLNLYIYFCCLFCIVLSFNFLVVLFLTHNYIIKKIYFVFSMWLPNPPLPPSLPPPPSLSFQPIMCVRFIWLCHVALAWCWCRLRVGTEGKFLFRLVPFRLSKALDEYIRIPIRLTDLHLGKTTDFLHPIYLIPPSHPYRNNSL